MQKWNQQILLTSLQLQLWKIGMFVGHLKIGKSGRFAKTIFFFLRSDPNNKCTIEITGKRCNLGDGEGLQVPCVLYFEGIYLYVERLKKILSSLWWNVVSHCPSTLCQGKWKSVQIIECSRFELSDGFSREKVRSAERKIFLFKLRECSSYRAFEFMDFNCIYLKWWYFSQNSVHILKHQTIWQELTENQISSFKVNERIVFLLLHQDHLTLLIPGFWRIDFTGGGFRHPVIISERLIFRT